MNGLSTKLQILITVPKYKLTFFATDFILLREVGMRTSKTRLILTAVLCMAMFLGCENGWWGANALNAVLFDNAGKWINLDFQRENVTRGFGSGLYLNGEFIYTDESYPKERIFIISDQAEFDTIFNEFPSGVNFENEMILLYVITSINVRPVFIKRIKLENERLHIRLKEVPPPKLQPDATRPQMRWFIVKIDKLYIDTVDFSWSS